MTFITSLLLVSTAATIIASPPPEPGFPHHVESTGNIAFAPRSWMQHIKRNSNTPFVPRAEKGICTTLELPTEASYKIGYEAFCNDYAPHDTNFVMGTMSDEVVATYMLKTHIGTEIPWIFKIKSTAWGGGKPYLLNRDKCIIGFRLLLEGPRAWLGEKYCVVDNSGGNGESKTFSGQGYVLVTGGSTTWSKGDVNDMSAFETRRRHGNP